MLTLFIILLRTTSLTANSGQAQAYQAYMPDFKPSYNAVQLNLSQPTLNVPQAQPFPPQGPAEAGKNVNYMA